MAVEKIRITSGPDESVYREIDITDCAVLNIQKPGVYDAAIKTIDGTEKVYTRRRRKNFAITGDGLTAAEYRVLERMCSGRQEVCLEANVGEDTILYNPFEMSEDPYLGPDATYTRASIATYQDEDGLVKEVATGLPRFEACKLGKGILLEPERTNYAYPSHPASGALVFAAGAGSPSLTWDANMSSNVDGEDGTCRVEADSGDTITASFTFPDATSAAAFIWIRGMGTVTASLAGLAVQKNSPVTALSGEWQQLIIEGGTSNTTTVVLTIGCSENNTRFWYSGIQVENGLTVTSYMPAPAASATRAVDNLSYAPVGLNYAQGSISFWLRWPRLITSCTNRMLFYVSANFYAQIVADGTISFRYSSTQILSDNTHGFSEGDFVHVACVWKDDFCGLILNGVAPDTSTDNTREAGAPSALQLYHTSDRVAHSLIDDLRVDSEYVEWRISEGGDYAKFSAEGNLELVRQTQGRLFRIKTPQFAPREGNSDLFDGTFILAESSSESAHTLGGA